MNLQELNGLLRHPKPNIRFLAIHIVNMVDEVRALPAIATQLKQEKAPKIATEFKTIGDRLFKMKKEGYDTVEAICEHFNVYSEVLTYADEEEFKEIHRMAYQVTDKRKDDDTGDRIVKAASTIIVSRVLGASAAIGMMTPSVDLSSNMGSVTESMQKQKKRVRPTIPSKQDITRWIKMLKSDNAEDRQQALVQLNSAKNPEGLQYMAHTFATDSEKMVRDTAKRLGKMLYWNNLYYEMEQDGTIEKVMNDFAATLGITLSKDVTSTQEMPMPQVAEQSIDDILKAAEKSRKKRGKRR